MRDGVGRNENGARRPPFNAVVPEPFPSERDPTPPVRDQKNARIPMRLHAWQRE